MKMNKQEEYRKKMKIEWKRIRSNKREKEWK